jgi:vitamin B12 transporter
MAKARNLRLSDESAAGAASVRVTGARASAQLRGPTVRAEAPSDVADDAPGVIQVIRLLTSTSLFTLALSTPAFAQTQTTPSSAKSANAVITVIATRIPTPKIAVASSVTVFTAADIATKQEQTLPDVLKDSPGLNVVQTGGPGGQTSVFMRGTNSDHVKVLVDGIDVSDPSSPDATFDFGQFLTLDIDRVEVLRGPQSGLYGSDAIGGVINVITKSGNGPPVFTAELEGGSFETSTQNAGVLGSTGPFHYAASIEHFQSAATPVTPLDLLLPGEKRLDDFYDNVTASTKLGYDVMSDFDLGLVARYTDTHLRFTGENEDNFPDDFPDATQSAYDTQQYYLLGTAHLALFDDRFNQTVGAAYSNIQTRDISPDTGLSEFAGNTFKANWQGILDVTTGESLILGAEHERDGISQPIDASTTIDSGYAELLSNPFTNFNNTVSLRYDANDRFGGAFTYRIAPTYFIEATGTKIEASVGTGFKAPTLSDLFENFPPFFFGNPNLRPETSTGYDVGFEQFLLNDTVQFGATYFYNNIRNLIDTNAAGDSLANVGRAHTDGVESYLAVKPIDTLTLRVDYTYTEAKDDVLHEELIRRPRNKWDFDARWQAMAKLSLDLNLLSIGAWVDGNRDFSIPRLLAPGYTTVDIAANYDVTSHITIYGRVTNLFDEQYQDPVGFLRPGRGAFIGVKGRF